MNGYTIIVRNAKGKAIEQEVVDTLGGVHNYAVDFVQDRMDAFGEDREALKGYGYIDAEDQALAIGDDGGTVTLPDGWKIEVTLNTDDKE